LINKVSIIGAGNVATHLAKSFFDNGFDIGQVFSRNLDNATILANQINAKAINTLSLLNSKADFYLICVKDDAVEQVLKNILFKDKVIAHTSGSVSMDIFFANNYLNYGIFYPLQTFSKDKEVNLKEIPFCIEGSNKSTENQLFEMALNLSDSVHFVNSEQRKVLHLAAVFACNFTNYMYTIANDITTKNDIDFDILKPLIKETAQKIMDNSPLAMQTGPAKRNDEEIIKNHLQMLSNNKAYQAIYKLITEQIINNKG
jgi:predicted short-subunit dehydrogenase-like oxidoreductase (DUF2520 family)